MKINQKIPEGWSVKKLGECFSFLKTPSYSRAETTDSGLVHYIHYGDIHTKYPLHVSPTDIDIFISEDQAQKGDFLQTGDLILLDASEDYEGTTKCIELINVESHDKVISGLHTLALRDDANNFADGFRAYITSMPFVKDLFWKQVSGFKVYGVSKDNLKKIKILLPPLAEQEKIAGILGTWDEAIEKLSDLIEQKKRLKKGLMQKLLTGQTRLSGFTQPWQEVKCKEFLKERKTYLTKGAELEHVSLTKEGVVPKTDRYNRDFLVKQADKEYKITKFHDICYNPANLKFGVICLNTYGEGIFSPIYVTYEIVKGNPMFFGYLLTTNDFIARARRYEEGTVYERMAVSSEDFQQVKVFIPSDLQEQEAIADVLSTADDEINLLNQKLEALKEQKKGLMQQLLTGQIRVKGN